MARQKSTTFQGASVFDTDVASPSYERMIANACGDVALIFDKVTGRNSETSLIVHDGTDNHGARLGIPLVNQWIGRSLFLTAPNTNPKGANGGEGETWILAYPLFLCTGETTLEIEVAARFDPPITLLNPMVRVFSTAFVLEKQAIMQILPNIAGETDTVIQASITGLTGGAVHYVAVVIDTSSITVSGDDPAIGKLHYCRIRPRMPMLGPVGHDFANQPMGIAVGPRAANDFGVTTPSATEGVVNRDFLAGMFASLSAVDAYTTAGLNRNINGLMEYITGWPAGGNATYVQQDQDGSGVADATNPARVRFEYHSRALYTSEAEIEFPIWSECFGAFNGTNGKFVVGLAEPPTIGMTEWYAPWPITTGAQSIRGIQCLMPDFQSTTSKLHAHVLIGSDASAAVGNWTVQIQTTTGSSSAVAPVACDGTNTLWKAAISAIPFTGDALEDVEIVFTRTGAKTGIGELCVIGACLYFDP